MKKFCLTLMVVMVSVMMIGCGARDNGGGHRDFLVLNNIRTDWQGFDVDGDVVRINSHAELQDYIRSYDDWEHFGAVDMHGNAVRPEYFNILETQFPASFFSSFYLVIVRAVATSGSIQHSVTRIDPDGTIHISQNIPEAGTDDMASWSLIIRLPRSFNPDTFNVACGCPI